ncbi:MAG: murein L,D-transpeptidase family protein [Chthoniobacterales bacterium]
MKYFLRVLVWLFLSITVLLIGFYYTGNIVFRSVKVHPNGKRTIAQVLKDLEKSISHRIPNIEALTDGKPLTILIFKEERLLELWKKNGTIWEFVKSYPLTGSSGKLGPKLREGDLQIPEGEYDIEYLNPNSSYHLSMKLNYPNEFDRKMAEIEGRTRPGFDIFVHGSNRTLGCIPIGDEKIEEIFYIIAKNGYQHTKVLIAPRDFRQGKSAPIIEEIEWENELYDMLNKRLREFQKIRL